VYSFGRAALLLLVEG